MKRFVFVLTVLLTPAVIFAGKKAENIMQKVYDNMNSIDTINTYIDTDVLGKDKKSMNRKILIKKPNKMKIIPVNSKTKTLLTDNTYIKSGKTEPFTNNNKVFLYPACLFAPEYFYKNYTLTVKEKDERIKRGMEEIIAIRTGQEREYPQIRLLVKKDQIKRIRFYDMWGKRHYELKIHKYDEFGEVKFPVKMTEKVRTRNDKTIRKINYYNTELNKPIPDSEFDAN